MRSFKTIVMLSCLPLFSVLGNNWIDSTSLLIKRGKFQHATLLLNHLSTNQKEAHLFQVDSLKTIMQRIRNDFNLTPQRGIEMIQKKYPSATQSDIQRWKENKYIETLNIDGQEWWFKRAVRNLPLLNPDMIHTDVKEQQKSKLLEYITEADQYPADLHHTRNWHKAVIQFTLDVDANAVPDGDTIRAWIPVPFNSERQRNFQLVASSSKALLSQDSPHHTVYLEARAQKDRKTHFVVLYAYEVAAQFFTQAELLKELRPYRTNTPVYQRYTASEQPHIQLTPAMKQLAQQIVGAETNPVLQASLIYDWICDRFPWASARDYSTIDNIPQYVLESGHGDCGQVTLLYITLARCLGIPARWESGWMLHPQEINYHDWAETYFEGIGWVPTDVSFGRTIQQAIRDYYKSGTDIYRMAANQDIGKPFSPFKKFIRTETVDSQAGEVEWEKGNLEKSQWNSSLKIIHFEPLDQKINQPTKNPL